MKKVIALLLAAVMLMMSFAACNTDYDYDDDDDAIEEKVKDKDTDETVAEDAADEEDDTDETVAEDTAYEEDDTDETVAEDTAAEAEEDESIRGEISGDVYYNEYTDITFTKPGSWEYADDEQLAAVVNVGVDQLNVDEAMKTLAQTGTIYDMMAYDPATGSNVIAIYEDLNVTNMGMKITAERYCDNVVKMLPATTGLPYEVVSQENVTLCGEEYVKVVLFVETQGVELTQVYFARAFDHLMYSCVFTLIGDISVEEVESMFD